MGESLAWKQLLKSTEQLLANTRNEAYEAAIAQIAKQN